MRGIDVMNSDPSKAKILYAKVESTDDILQRLADEVAAFYLGNSKRKIVILRTLDILLWVIFQSRNPRALISRLLFDYYGIEFDFDD